MRLKLLGEPLIAFRDSSGRLGVMDHRCPHRCATCSMAATRKTASAASIMAGNTMSTATASTSRTCRRTRIFKDKVKAKAYKAVGAQRRDLGLYGRPRGRRRRCPMLEATLMPRPRSGSASCSANAIGSKRSRAISTPRISAFSISVLGSEGADAPARPGVFDEDRAPEYICEVTEYGTMYGAYRPAESGFTYWRLAFRCFRSGPFRRTAISPPTSWRAPGCRSTTRIACSSSGSGRHHAEGAAPQDRRADSGGEFRPASHAEQHRLARTIFGSAPMPPTIT